MPSALMKTDHASLPVEELRQELRRALIEAGGSVADAGKLLGLTKHTTWRMLYRAGIAHEPAIMCRRLGSRYRLRPTAA